MRNYNDTYSNPTKYEIGRDDFDNEILSHTVFEPNKTVFEVGCGNGRFLKKLITMYPSLELCGLDTSQNGIDVCSMKLSGEFICDDILRYDPILQYDYVMCFNTLEHFTNPEDVLSKIVELTKPNGTVYLTIPNIDTDTCKDHVQWWSVESFSEFVSDYFDVKSCELIDNDQNILLHGILGQ
jgi:2-polyprenyl-3-methyl-5-hydroxy-6-metoxy-1,4-benzoquinol methylase